MVKKLCSTKISFWVLGTECIMSLCGFETSIKILDQFCSSVWQNLYFSTISTLIIKKNLFESAQLLTLVFVKKGFPKVEVNIFEMSCTISRGVWFKNRVQSWNLLRYNELHIRTIKIGLGIEKGQRYKGKESLQPRLFRTMSSLNILADPGPLTVIVPYSYLLNKFSLKQYYTYCVFHWS